MENTPKENKVPAWVVVTATLISFGILGIATIPPILQSRNERLPERPAQRETDKERLTQELNTANAQLTSAQRERDGERTRREDLERALEAHRDACAAQLTLCRTAATLQTIEQHSSNP